MANAAEYHARAAEHARERFAHDTALHHVQRGLGLLEEIAGPEAPTMQLAWRLLVVSERTHDLLGQHAEQVAAIDALAPLAEALDDDSRRATVALHQSYTATHAADWPAGERAALRAMALAERAGDHETRLEAQLRVARSRAKQGDPTGGKALAEQGLAEARQRGLQVNEAQLLNVLQLIAEQEGDLMRSLDLSRQALALDIEIGNRRGEAIERGNLGSAWLTLGDFAQAERHLSEALRMVRAHGDRGIEHTMLCNLATLALWQGDDARALALARSGHDVAVAVEARGWQVYALLGVGGAELALGRDAAAAQAFAQARALAVETADPEQHAATAGLARVALAQGNGAAALQDVAPVLAHLAGGGTLDGTESPRLIELTCHRVLARAGDARAGEWLARAHTGLQAQAAAIDDEAVRRGFLHNIPHHREIVAAWGSWPRAKAV